MIPFDGSNVSNGLYPVRRSFWIAIVLAVILLSTRPVELGDTRVYANDIVGHLGKSLFGPANSLWEPGHVLWRPLGWALLSLASSPLSALTDWTPFMQASFVLMAVSVLCALVTVVLWHAMVIRMTGSKGLAFMVAIAMACSDGFLLRVASGSAYIPGLMCITASLCFLGRGKTILGALFYGLSVLLWLPFILAGPALLLLAACPSWNWNTPLKEIFAKVDLAGAIRFTVISATIVVLVYGFAIYALRASSAGEAENWFVAANHGYSPNIKLVRIASGLPRSFLYLGRDGILYKRFLWHDPYSPVTLWNIAIATSWKLIAFYLFCACLLYELLRRPRSGWLVLFFMAGVAPIILFALTLFETGSAERYLPALPFLLIATAWALRDFPASRRVTQFGIAAFLLCVVLTNGYSFAAPRISAEDLGSLARVADLRSRLTSASIVMVTTDQDDLDVTVNRLAFDNVNRPTPMHMYYVIRMGNVQVLSWRQELAARTLTVWKHGGDVWVSNRLWSPRPLPSWNWVEGDDRGISWRELPQFFAALNTDAVSGGPDGFRRLARNEANRALLTPLGAGIAVPQ